MPSYHPKTFHGLTWHGAVAGFRAGNDTPRAYLERCLGAVAAREDELRAFVVLDRDLAREAADDSTARWAAGQPLSPTGAPVHLTRTQAAANSRIATLMVAVGRASSSSYSGQPSTKACCSQRACANSPLRLCITSSG